MRRLRSIDLTGLCLLSVPLLCLVWNGARGSLSSSHGSSQQVLVEAKRFWVQAQMWVDSELHKSAAENPEATRDGVDGCRRQLLAQDQMGDLRRAAAAARRAMVQARNLDERYQASLWLALIECDRGHHQTETRLVRQLMRRESENPEAFGRSSRRNGPTWTCWRARLLKH